MKRHGWIWIALLAGTLLLSASQSRSQDTVVKDDDYHLSFFFENNEGKSPSELQDLLFDAEANGCIPARFILGASIYTKNQGEDTEPDLLVSIIPLLETIREKANTGNPDAMLALSMAYNLGIGVMRDGERARHLQEEAGRIFDMIAARQTGNTASIPEDQVVEIFMNAVWRKVGEKADMSEREAELLINKLIPRVASKAAEGEALAQLALSFATEFGYGLPRNQEHAQYWMNLAVENAEKTGDAQIADKLLEEMTMLKAKQTKTALRALAVACEAYYVDYNVYPPSSDDPSLNLSGSNHPAFGKPVLTTPIAYLSYMPVDTFAEGAGKPYQYHNAGNSRGWIAWSAGPDGDYDLDWQAYNPFLPAPEAKSLLLPYSYDPTNGTLSDGDIWRLKE